MKPADYRLAQARQMLEAELLRDVRALAKQLGWETYHTHNSQRSEPGWPDLALARDGVLLFRELKREQGALSPAQQKWIRLLQLSGADVGVWRPRDLLDGSIHRTLTALATRAPDARELALAPNDR